MFPRAAGLFTALAARRDSPRIREADYGKKERSSHDGREREREKAMMVTSLTLNARSCFPLCSRLSFIVGLSDASAVSMVDCGNNMFVTSENSGFETNDGIDESLGPSVFVDDLFR